MDFPLQTNRLGYTGWAPQDSVQLPKKSGWILWFMVDIAVVFVDIILLENNQNRMEDAVPCREYVFFSPGFPKAEKNR